MCLSSADLDVHSGNSRRKALQSGQEAFHESCWSPFQYEKLLGSTHFLVCKLQLVPESLASPLADKDSIPYVKICGASQRAKISHCRFMYKGSVRGFQVNFVLVRYG
jgi:hypothetical protein